jgi:hypothetical protein
MFGRGGDRSRLGIVKVKALDPNLIFQPGDVLGLPRRGEHPPAAHFQRLRRTQPDARRAAGDEDRPPGHRPGVVATNGSFRSKDLLLDAIEAGRKDIDDLLGGVVRGDALGVERRLPEDRRALRVSRVLLDAKLRLMVHHRQRAFDDLVAVAGMPDSNSFSLMVPPFLSVRVRKVMPPSSISWQSATRGCQSLMAQKSPAMAQTLRLRRQSDLLADFEGDSVG